MTQYCLVQDDVIVEGPGPLPDVWNDGERDWDLRPMTDPELEELGWLPVVYTDQPPNTDVSTHDSSIVLVDGVPTTVWTERPWTPEELAGQESQQNVSQLTSESSEAVDKLVLVVENLNLMTDQTNATINANPASFIKDLARECKTIARQANREARLTSGRTEDTYTGEEVP